MVETSFPKCPICKEEVLLPFSVSGMERIKVYAHWVCTNCGFCIGTSDTRGCNPESDVILSFLEKLVEEVKSAREHYRKY